MTSARMSRSTPRSGTDIFSEWAEARHELIRLEDDLGLGNMSRLERDLHYAIRDVADANGGFTSRDLREHQLLQNVPPASFHRALVRLVEVGRIRHADDSLARNYVINQMP